MRILTFTVVLSCPLRFTLPFFSHNKGENLTHFILGWQPTIQEGAANWDEDWDKFVDEGLNLCNIMIVLLMYELLCYVIF